MNGSLRKSGRLIHNRPFSWQDKGVIRYLRDKLAPELGMPKDHLRILLCIYTSLTEIDSNQMNKGIVCASYKYIARLAATSVSTARRYTAELVDLGLIIKRNTGSGKVRWASEWVLCDWRDEVPDVVLDKEHTAVPGSFTEMFLAQSDIRRTL